MLEQLVECENRLLEEQRRFNELLLAWRSGDLGDDLTRMKIEQMQREVDALGRQLTALRTVIAAQADRERAGYRQGAMPKAAYGWPAYGQAVAAAQPWNQTMPQPAVQTAETGNPQQAYQQTPPQPAVQTAETGNPIPPAPGAMSQSARETGNPQQAYQQTPPQPAVQTAETGGGSTGGIPAGIREAGSGKNDRQGDSAGLRCRTDLPESGVFCDAGAAVS